MGGKAEGRPQNRCPGNPKGGNGEEAESSLSGRHGRKNDHFSQILPSRQLDECANPKIPWSLAPIVSGVKLETDADAALDQPRILAELTAL